VTASHRVIGGGYEFRLPAGVTHNDLRSAASLCLVLYLKSAMPGARLGA
jgi:hypothetical protein